jgi:hypothetical protein
LFRTLDQRGALYIECLTAESSRAQKTENQMYVEGGDFGSRDFRRSVWHQTTTAVALLTCAAKDHVNVMACEWAMLA